MALNPLLKKLVSQGAQKFKGNSGNVSKLKEGRNVIRLIVPQPNEVEWVKDDGMFYREVGVHWIKADENSKPIAVVGSSEICYGTPSTLAAAIDMAIANAYDEESKKLYDSWKARKTIYVNVVNRDAGDEVQIMELSPTTFGKLMDAVQLYDDQGVDVLSHSNGIDFVITKTGKGLNTTYDVSVLPLAPGKMCKAVTTEQVRQAANLDEYISANYFRGDEPKALNAVATIAGIAVPALGAPKTPVAALTSSAATVADAPAAVVAPVAPAAPVTPVVTPEALAAAQAHLLEQQRQAEAQAAAQAAAAAAQAAALSVAAAAPAAVVTPTTSISDLASDEQDRLLAELNAIGA